MTDQRNSFNTQMKFLGPADWYRALQRLTGPYGFFESLGPSHSAALVARGETLLVTFESRQGIQALSDMGQPLGFDMVQATGWSNLALISEGDTWFRDREIYDFFDSLDDEGFFDDYEKVIFYGAGPCGYAACAFARAAQDSTIVAIQPQATLDPDIAGWDKRFTKHRKLSFAADYGYAPEFMDLCEQLYLIYDPLEALDAMHAALFLSPQTTFLRTPHLGGNLQSDLLEMSLLYRILARAGAGNLTAPWFHRLMRARRGHPPYLRGLMARLERDKRYGLLDILYRNVPPRLAVPRFEGKREKLKVG